MMWLLPIFFAGSCLLLSLEAASECPSSFHGCVCMENPLEIQCIDTGLDQVPEDMPPETLILTFRGNNFPFIDRFPLAYRNLLSLELDRNNIHYVRDDAFLDLKQMEELYLENNQISSLSSNSFSGLESARLLDLAYNHLYEIEPRTFDGGKLPHLESLNLAFSKIYGLHPGSFVNLTSLRILNISHNSLDAMHTFGDYLSFPVLEVLDLSFNSIGQYLNASVFKFMPKLEQLILTGNRIQTVQRQTWEGLENSLQVLRLQRNNLYYVENNAFANLRVLTTLDLSYNNLQMLDMSRALWNQLDRAFVHHNPWRCDCGNDWLISSRAVSLWNDNQTLLCSSPASLSGQPVSRVPTETFEAKNCAAPAKRPSLILIIAVGMLCVVVIVLASVFCVRHSLTRKKNVSAALRSKCGTYRRMDDLIDDAITNQDL